MFCLPASQKLVLSCILASDEGTSWSANELIAYRIAVASVEKLGDYIVKALGSGWLRYVLPCLIGPILFSSGAVPTLHGVSFAFYARIYPVSSLSYWKEATSFEGGCHDSCHGRFSSIPRATLVVGQDSLDALDHD